MRSFVRLTDFDKAELEEIFKIADSIEEYDGFFNPCFFPAIALPLQHSLLICVAIFIKRHPD